MTYHEGELKVQTRVGVSHMAARIGRGIHESIPPRAQHFLLHQTLSVVSSTAPDEHVWASLLTGEPGFLTAISDQDVKIAICPSDDILFENLKQNNQIGLIAIDFATRQRMRINGHAEQHPNYLIIKAQQVYANCPQYIHARDAKVVEKESVSTEKTATLSKVQRNWIETADTFFIASRHHEGGADASHRGGEPGFVRVSEDNILEFPDYSGNAMFNTLGNIAVNPNAGLLFIDFDTNSTLQLSGKAKIVWDANRIASFSNAERVVEYQIETIIETRNIL